MELLFGTHSASTVKQVGVSRRNIDFLILQTFKLAPVLIFDPPLAGGIKHTHTHKWKQGKVAVQRLDKWPSEDSFAPIIISFKFKFDKSHEDNEVSIYPPIFYHYIPIKVMKAGGAGYSLDRSPAYPRAEKKQKQIIPCLFTFMEI